ncbi:MAG: phosphoribosylformylglycinamidine synthase I [Chloroflexota bacterium]|nr:phosphoribosylformylglycinamidine synthase I [Chloroflexota bacterium]
MVDVLILHATGTNRDREAAWAVEKAGGNPVILHVNALRDRTAWLHDFQMLILPGGFSYGDALGAGRLLASDLRWLFEDELADFIESGKPILGICNGFQALVKSGWLPGPPADGTSGPLRTQVEATLTRNASNRFECRWVWLEPEPESVCVFTRGLAGREDARITCPVAHGEGRFVPDDGVLGRLHARGQIALTYVSGAARDGRRRSESPANYPANPNGSVADIAGICNEQGNVLGLMPHPEDHIVPWQHPRWTRGERGGLALDLFVEGLAYARGR